MKRTPKFRSKIFFLLVLASFFAGIVLPVFSIGTTGVLSGTVKDKDSGTPVDNVVVTAKGPSQTYTATTDAQGFFVITGVEIGYYQVNLERVGYESLVDLDVNVTADATTHLPLAMRSQPIQLAGTTVQSVRTPLTNPHQPMTNYGYQGRELNALLPPVGPNLAIPNIYETFPGVQVSYDAYYGPNAAHIRGGTGSDIGYAFDGVPTTEPISNTFATTLTNMYSERNDFYVGAYPPQYGNFLSGYVNQVPPRGYGKPHGSIAFTTGFWADSTAAMPVYNSVSGNNPAYTGSLPANNTNINLEIGGKDRRLNYYLNHVIQDGSPVPFPAGVDLKPVINESTGGLQNYAQNRDTLLNLNYELNTENNLQFLYYTGIQKLGFLGFQGLPCNPNDSNAYGAGSNYNATCLGANTATGFGESFNPNTITPLSDSFQIATYTLAKLELTHRFNRPGSVLNLRAWRFSPAGYFNYFSIPGNLWEFRHSEITGALAEHQNQITPTHLLDIGISYMVSKNFLRSSKLDIGSPADISDRHFDNVQQVLYNSSTPGGTLNTVLVPDTQTIGAWFSDEWRPTPKWDIYAGLRYDSQNYLLLTGSGLFTAQNGLPFVKNSLCPGVIVGLCSDPGRFKPSLLSPRLGASYQLSNKLTMKTSYGKFITFAPARRVESIQISGGGSASNGTLPPSGSLAAIQLAGSKQQTGESFDVSWEYQLDDNSFIKITPYVKHIVDPLESVVVNGVPGFQNAGTIGSKGVEVFLRTRNWHNLSGQISYTYSTTKGSQIPFETGITSSLIGATGSPFTAGSVISDNAQIVPLPYDERHMLNVSLNYKIGKWEIAPSFFYGSGTPYGLGAQNLRGLAAVQNSASVIYGGATAVPANGASINPLGESSFNSRRNPAWWIGNLAISYHFNDDVKGILTIFNVLNSNQVIGRDNQTTPVSGTFNGYPENPVSTSGVLCCYNSADGTVAIAPVYDPNLGHYAPTGYPNLRQFFLTLQYDFH